MRDMEAVDINTMSWGRGLAADRTTRRSALNQHRKAEEEKPLTSAARRQERIKSIRPEITHTSKEPVGPRVE